jgi:RHS repeat-associated protein
VTYPSGGGSATDYYLQYNALGQRMRATLNGTTWRYVYFGERVLEERNDAGGTLARYTLADGSYFGVLLHHQRNDGGVHKGRWPVYDSVGAIRRLVDDSGAVTDSYDLTAFGEQYAAGGTMPNPYRYGGAWGYLTEGSGLLQLGARFYWPELGRFLQQDPLRLRRNRYAYAGSNPLVRMDPTGLVDLFGGFEGDAIGITGFEGGFGVVIDFDDPLASGFYGTAGPAGGANAGWAWSVGLARRDIEGWGLNYDMNTPWGVSPVASFDDQGFNSVALGLGPGVGLSASFTETQTYTVRDAINDFKSFYQDLKDIWWWLTTDPCDY